MRKIISRAAALLLAAVMTLSLTAFASAAVTKYATADVRVRSGPGTGYAILGCLKKGQAAAATGNEVNGWVQIRFSEYELGYVSGRYLADRAVRPDGGCPPFIPCGECPPLGTDSGFGDIYYATTGLNVRSGPGTRYSIIGGLEKYQKVTRIGVSGNWYKLLTSNGRDAYASGRYLRPYRAGSACASGTSGSSVCAVNIYRTTVDLNMRGGPNAKQYPVTGVLRRGEAVTFLGKTSGKWMLVRNSRGLEGWCYGAYLKACAPRGQWDCRPEGGQVVCPGSSCGGRCDNRFNWSCSAGVSVGGYYRPNYDTRLYSAPPLLSSRPACIICTIGTGTVVRVEGILDGWALVRIRDTATCGYVPIAAIA